MSSYIPNKLHFVWGGELLPRENVRSFARWVFENPNYTVSLWSQRKFGELYAGDIAQELAYISGVHLNMEDNEKQIKIFKDFDRWKVAVRSDNPIRPFRTFEVRFTEGVRGISDPFTLSEEKSTWRNNGPVNDILRLWILNQEGGIYMNFETKSVGLPLPINIVAPKDILLGVMNDSTAYFTDAVLATPQSSPKIRSLLEYMDALYTKEEDTTLPFSTQDDADEARTKLQDPNSKPQLDHELDKNALDDLVPEEWSKFAKDREAEGEARKRKMEEEEAGIDYIDEKKIVPTVLLDQATWRTLKLNGPQMMTEWLEKYEGVVATSVKSDLYNLVKQSGYPLQLESVRHWMTT